MQSRRARASRRRLFHSAPDVVLGITARVLGEALTEATAATAAKSIIVLRSTQRAETRMARRRGQRTTDRVEAKPSTIRVSDLTREAAEEDACT